MNLFFPFFEQCLIIFSLRFEQFILFLTIYSELYISILFLFKYFLFAPLTPII